MKVDPPDAGLPRAEGLQGERRFDIIQTWPEAARAGRQALRGPDPDCVPAFSEAEIGLPDGNGIGLVAPAMLRVLSVDSARPVGRIGQGSYSYCSLSLPRQMDALVAGAFRLFVNLISAP